jgi:hypothetical protein
MPTCCIDRRAAYQRTACLPPRRDNCALIADRTELLALTKLI